MKTLFAFALCAAVLASSSVVGHGKGQGIRRAKKPIPSQYVVVLQPGVDPEGTGHEFAGRFNGQLKHIYKSALRGFAVRLSPEGAAALAEDPRVLVVEEDAEIQAAQVQSNPPWGLDRIDQRALPLDLTYVYGAPSAQQVTVHVIDTGVRTSHYEFAGRAYNAADYVDDDHDGNPYDVGNDDSDPSRMDGQDCHGHGTHVAGTIAGLTVGVAKNVVIQSHRVLGCDGSGTTSGVIAAIDAVTESDARPAVANMSLGGDVSYVLDLAIQRSIAAGVTYVVAAGNANQDASNASPAHVAEAITVGATTSSDARASYSNYGPVVDLFAPGSSIKSALYTSDSGFTSMSGTSMATPHVAGAAALYLERNPSATPSQVRNALVGAATTGRVINAGTGSPNLLLYTGFMNTSTPATVTLLSPDGGEKLFTAHPFTIRWDITNGGSVTRIDVFASVDDGASYAPIAGCSNLPSSARACTWSAPGPATSKARVRVVATDSSGRTATDTSAGGVIIVSGAGTITVTSPNTVVNWGRTSAQQIKWNHNLGANSYVRVELSRDGGVTFPETLAAALRNTTDKSGTYDWRVTGPNVSNAVVRVTWTNGPVSDVSNTTFTIAEPFLTVAAPSTAATDWGYGTRQAIYWTTNLGPLDTVDVLLATDGTTFSPVANKVAASALSAVITVPTLASPTTLARVRVAWTNAPGTALSSTNPIGFKIQPAFVTVLAPNGGEVWTVGTAQSVRWALNLGSLETLDIQLSKDGGATWTTVLANKNKIDKGAHAFTIDANWVTERARIRLVWPRNTAVADQSNANFAVR